MLNKCFFIGHLTDEPDLKYGPSGVAVGRFSIACNEAFIKEGKREERVEFVRIVCFQKQAENCSKYLHKGSLVFVEGSLTTNKWTDQQGQTRYTTEIKAQRVQFLDKREGAGGQNQTHHQQQRPDDDDIPPAFPSEAQDMDSIPF